MQLLAPKEHVSRVFVGKCAWRRIWRPSGSQENTGKGVRKKLVQKVHSVRAYEGPDYTDQRKNKEV